VRIYSQDLMTNSRHGQFDDVVIFISTVMVLPVNSINQHCLGIHVFFCSTQFKCLSPRSTMWHHLWVGKSSISEISPAALGQWLKTSDVLVLKLALKHVGANSNWCPILSHKECHHATLYPCSLRFWSFILTAKRLVRWKNKSTSQFHLIPVIWILQDHNLSAGSVLN